MALAATSIAVAGSGLALAAPPLTGSGTGSIETFKPPYTGSANPGTVAAPPLTGSGTGSVETFKPPYTGSANPGTV
ncbi:hypothetical protein ACFTVM_44505, partial [Nocardia sp. NPDC057030]